ncbi:MAG: glycosyltransferase family 39 protein [Candidatus Protistobacter heckmanni]|nr:glycosyltransferase family 39 protein [Candidatus Protistobacter heckmanni]
MSAQQTPVTLTADATRTLPRWILLSICVVYGLSGLFFRDPWKSADAAGFGVMWSMAQGVWYDWLMPNIAGRPYLEHGPLVFWLGGGAIKIFGPVFGAPAAARLITAFSFFSCCALIWRAAYLLGRRPEVQPYEFTFGGQPNPRDYGRAIADSALLAFLACAGLAEHGHETTAAVGQLALVSLLCYGIVRSLDHPRQGSAIAGAALGMLLLAAGPVLAVFLGIATAVAKKICKPLAGLSMLRIVLPIALAVGLVWPLLLWLDGHLHAGGDGLLHLKQWWRYDFDRYLRGPSWAALTYTGRNILLYTWPLWPLAIWSWRSWGGRRRAPHIAVPLTLAGAVLLLILLQTNAEDMLFMLLAPALAIAAAFGLPTLKRGAGNAIDWFALLVATVIGVFVWLVWLAKMTGYPEQTARNLYRLVPGLRPEFSITALVLALLITAAWVLIVHWRLARARKVIWRSVVISAAGTTLTWVLMMTLWLPTINYARTYRDVVSEAAAALPKEYRCVQAMRMGDAQLASFAYFGQMRFGGPEENCDLLLRYDRQDFGAPTSVSRYHWKLLWEGHRPADRDERFRLYVLEQGAERPTRKPLRKYQRSEQRNERGDAAEE